MATRNGSKTAAGSTGTQTITEEPLQRQADVNEQVARQPPQQLVLHLRPHPTPTSSQQPQLIPPSERRVTFTPETIDNEHLGRLKSNCCCIYVPPRKWDDPSTWTPDESETEHCRGHTLPPPQPPADGKKPDENNNKDGKDDGPSSGHGPGCC